MTIMAKNAPEYGLDQITPDPAVEYDTIVTTSPTNLALIGDISDTPISQLVPLNPALLRGIAPGNFEIRVPKGTGAQVTAGLDLVPTEQRASSRMHRVEPGESLASIAHLYSASVTQIVAANNLKDSDPSQGDRLVVPAAYHEVIPALKTPTVQARGTRSFSRTPAKTRAAATVSAKRPLHPAAATLAQLKDRNRSLNR
jgi:membrane-bound lytic murein transglycosylase D